MLQAIRKGVSSWVARILLGLIIVAFAIFFGFGDFATGPREVTVAEVGDVDITATEFSREFRQFQNRFGANLDVEQMRQLGLHEALLRQMIERALLDQTAADFGLAISDGVIAEIIRTNPAFRNELGQFDRFIFESALRNIGMNEAMFVALTRQDMLRAQIVDAVTASGSVPEVLAETLYGYRNERRVADLLVIPHDDVGEIADPDEGALADFHQENASRFTAPEYRAVTYVTLTPEDLVDEIEVSEEELREEYDYRLDEFVSEERREVEQIVFGDEDAARAAYERLAAGADFTAVGDESGGAVDLGAVTRDELPEEVSEAVFGLAENTVGEPVQSPFGWHVFRVGAVESGGTRSFDEVRDTLEAELKLRRATDALFDLANRLEDALAGGATLEEAALEIGLKTRTLEAVDAPGQDRDGRAIASLFGQDRFLRTVFETDPGFDSPLIETDAGGYFALRVDKVIPSELRPLESVRDEVIAAWKQDQRRQAARDKARDAAERVRRGAALETVAAELGLAVRRSPPLTRDQSGADDAVSPSLLAQLFAAEETGAVASAPSRSGDAEVVARLVEIQEAERDPAALESLTGTLAGGYGNDLMEQFRNALEAELGVSVDQRAVDQILAGAS